MVPDYMHCVLLGITKTILLKHLSPTNSQKPYFVGKHLHHISRRLKNLKPPDYIDRLPRDLVSNYQNLKASELQAWLLYFCIPCLHGFLPDKYLHHLAMLSEGIYICLSDTISESDLQRAQMLLDNFYKDFAELYGEGSCGLNVHNVGAHMCFYVKQWGPLFAWSCFGFEDCNAEILSFAHGTGDVTKQLLRMKEARVSINSAQLGNMRKTDAGMFLTKMNKRYSRKWTSAKAALNCNIAGVSIDFIVPNDCTPENILQQCKASKLQDLREVLRIEVDGDKFYANKYERLKKRICHVVLCKTGSIVDIDIFLWNKVSNLVYALGKIIKVADVPHLFRDTASHIICVQKTSEVVIIPAQDLKEKVCVLTVENQIYVCRVPNKHIGVMK